MEARSPRSLRDPAQPLTVKDLFEAGVHFGHQTKRWNPKMRPYIYGARSGIHIVDLDQTTRMFKRAFDYIVEAVGRGGSVLFVGTKRQAQQIRAAKVRTHVSAHGGRHYFGDGARRHATAAWRNSLRVDRRARNGLIRLHVKKVHVTRRREAEHMRDLV
jgi:ribosomal protein S2